DMKWSRFPTRIFDLTESEDALFKSMKEETRYEIRRALHRDRIICVYYDPVDEEKIQRFCRFFNNFAGHKGLGPASIGRLRGLARRGGLVLTEAVDETSNSFV